MTTGNCQTARRQWRATLVLLSFVRCSHWTSLDPNVKVEGFAVVMKAENELKYVPSFSASLGGELRTGQSGCKADWKMKSIS